MPISSDDFEACHRLPKGRNKDIPSRTIVRLVNRRKCEEALRKRKKLKDESLCNKLKVGRLYINESLCPYYRKIWYHCKCLFKEALVDRFWCDGVMKISITEGNDTNNHTIEHLDDLRKLFPGYDFDYRGQS